MTQPAKRTNKHQVYQVLKSQSWVLCISIVLLILIDQHFNGNGMLIARSFTCGAVLSFISQLVITLLTFQYTGYKARQKIMGKFYLGVVCRWLIALLGFALIFIFINPLLPILVIIGYLSLQISFLFLLWKI